MDIKLVNTLREDIFEPISIADNAAREAELAKRREPDIIKMKARLKSLGVTFNENDPRTFDFTHGTIAVKTWMVGMSSSNSHVATCLNYKAAERIKEAINKEVKANQTLEAVGNPLYRNYSSVREMDSHVDMDILLEDKYFDGTQTS